MIRYARIFRLTLTVAVFSLVALSCRKETAQEYSYFVSKEKVAAYQESTISAQIDVAGLVIPEALALKPYVISNVDVYRVVYKTTINGQVTNASGIVCVPQEPGEYPILSFQNGTNTLLSDAPSQSPLDFSFAFVESMASMGYIVALADYPGFGESSEFAHPYLIAGPTVRSLVDLLYTIEEMSVSQFPGVSATNDVYVTGYSQGGWSSLQLHKALELEYSDDFTLKGSCCGAGPYNIYLLLQNMVNSSTYPMPVYIGYILNAYKVYDQFTNPVSDILNEPYASRLPSLFTGQLNFGEINSQLTTSISGLLTQDFLSGFATAAKFSPVREALLRNSISPWNTSAPLLLIHGGSDTQVSPSATENMYASMIQAGTSPDIIGKVIIPGADHGDGVVPAMIMGLVFLEELKSSR